MKYFLLIAMMLTIPVISWGSDVGYLFNGQECLAMFSTGGGGGKTPSQAAYKGQSKKHMQMLGDRDRLFAYADTEFEGQEKTIKKQKNTISNQQFEIDAANERARQAEQAKFGSDGTIYIPMGKGTYMNSDTGELIY